MRKKPSFSFGRVILEKRMYYICGKTKKRVQNVAMFLINSLHLQTMRFYVKNSLKSGFNIIVLVSCLYAMVSCLPSKERIEVDHYNERAYAFHYRCLDSVVANAQRAYVASSHYNDGKAEALNNMAFVNIAKMNYDKASEQLHEVAGITDNQIELLIADIQMMRICQRRSENKDFYRYREKAVSCLNRIGEDDSPLAASMPLRCPHIFIMWGRRQSRLMPLPPLMPMVKW